MHVRSILSTLALAACALSTSISATEFSYETRNFSHLLGTEGFSDQALKNHFKLYGGYVKNTNLLLEKLNRLPKGPEHAELKRRLGWEFNGMRLHELYFENLSKKRMRLSTDSALYEQLEKCFGSFKRWQEDFKKTGALRGIGWAVLYNDPHTGHLVNVWINEHDLGHLAGATPILIMDVFEHAYMPDYQLNRKEYIEAFVEHINWEVAEERFYETLKK